MQDKLPKNLEDTENRGLLSLQMGTEIWEPYYLDNVAWSQMRKIMSSWLGTPYRHCTMVKGRGADCTLFIGACWLEHGVLKDVTWDYYSKDWHIHTQEEKVMDGLYEHFCHHANDGFMVLRLGKDAPLIRGDLIAFALAKTGVSNHAAVYLGPTEQGKLMLHAVQSKGVSTFPLAGYFERHKSSIFRIMRRVYWAQWQESYSLPL